MDVIGAWAAGVKEAVAPCGTALTPQQVKMMSKYAPLVVVQILTGIVLGPGVLGAVFPEAYRFVFTPAVVQSLSGVAWWAHVAGFLLGVTLSLLVPRRGGRPPPRAAGTRRRERTR
jgi:membrane associated rhomboid family serine protease